MASGPRLARRIRQTPSAPLAADRASPAEVTAPHTSMRWPKPNVRPIGFHDLRHTSSAWILDNRTHIE